jgi:hypothetical protein
MSALIPQPLAPFDSVPDDEYRVGIARVLASICAAVYLPSREWARDATVSALEVRTPPIDNMDDAHCFIGDIPGTNKTVLAFRGTGPISTKNWLADFELRLIPSDGDDGIQVHEGFAATLTYLMPQIKQVLPRDRMVWITGHSLGGALATLACRELKNEGFQIEATYTFGGPRVGNAGFANSLPAPLYRFVYGVDIVPHLPPQGVYQHGGIKVSLSRDGTVTRAADLGDGGDAGMPDLVSLAVTTDRLASGCGNPLLDKLVSDVSSVLPNPQQDLERFLNDGLIDAFIKEATQGQDAAAIEAVATAISPAFVPGVRDHFPGRYVNALERAQ